MSDAEILQKAIEKAAKNGWHPWSVPWRTNDLGVQLLQHESIDFVDARLIIYDHEFAKAFFEESCYRCPNWKDHLQKMILEEQPLRYLEQFLL